MVVVIVWSLGNRRNACACHESPRDLLGSRPWNSIVVVMVHKGTGRLPLGSKVPIDIELHPKMTISRKVLT